MPRAHNLAIAASPSPQTPAPEVQTFEFRRNIGQISKQSVVFFAGTLFTMAAGYLVKVYVARVLGAANLGIYALGMTLVSLTQLVGVLGLHSAAGRYVAVYNATGKWNDLRGFLTRSVGIILGLNAVACIVLVLSGPWISRRLYHAPDLARYIPMFAALTILGSLNVFYCQVLAGFKDVSKRTVITNFIGSSLVIVLTVILLAAGTGMWGYLSAQIVNSIVVVALLIGLAWKLTPQAARFSAAPLPPFDPEIKAFAAAAIGMGVLDFLVTQADKIVLGFYLTPALVGIYVIASTLSALIPMILQSVNQIFAPVIADLHAQGRREVLERLFQTLTKWILGLSLPLAFVIIIFARPLLRIFGPAFEAGWAVLVIGAVGQIVNCGVGSVGFLLLMSGNQRRLIRVQFVMAAVSVLVNVSLIPLFGIVGAALAAATVNAAGNIWNLAEVRKALGIQPYNRSYFGLLLPAVCAALVGALLRRWNGLQIHPWVAILGALIMSYAAFAGLALKYALDQDDRMIARAAWWQIRNALQLGVKA
jgi:O-antigen/teichoic acid export membrane protein